MSWELAGGERLFVNGNCVYISSHFFLLFMNSSLSLASRAIMAVALMIGFYLLALALVGILAGLAYADLFYSHHIHPKLVLGCLVGAGVIAWSVLPRFDKFEAPGPQLSREKHPRLFAELETISQAVGQSMPAEVYLVPDINAWVSERGGLMGFGSRRIMGLGLPLLRILTKSQFRAVLAHEFGHYSGSDTKLGPWIYKTRSAIGRTLHSLADTNGDGSLLQQPFLWYGNMFLRITHGISRQQEYVADRLAARVAGAKPLVDGLKTIHAVAPAYNHFLMAECSPVLNSGFRPPIIEGFDQFLQCKDVAKKMAESLSEEMANSKSDSYDTHPSLKERIDALPASPAPDKMADANETAAISLLDDYSELESELINSLAGAENAGELESISWEEVCKKVYEPQWQSLLKVNTGVLRSITLESLPSATIDLVAFGRKLATPSAQAPSPEDAPAFAATVLGAALSLYLLGQGWHSETAPGQPVILKREPHRVEPFKIIEQLASGAMSPIQWQQLCSDLAIGGSLVPETT